MPSSSSFMLYMFPMERTCVCGYILGYMLGKHVLRTNFPVLSMFTDVCLRTNVLSTECIQSPNERFLYKGSVHTNLPFCCPSISKLHTATDENVSLWFIRMGIGKSRLIVPICVWIWKQLRPKQSHPGLNLKKKFINRWKMWPLGFNLDCGCICD